MNKFDVRYEIRLANKNDINNIMVFLKEYWRADHVLANDKKLFEYEYCFEDNVNMVVAIDRTTYKIEGVFGFIYCSYPKKNGGTDIWGSIWKVNDDKKTNNIPLLGIELAKRAYLLTGCRMHIGNGANPKTTIPLRKMFFHDQTSKMFQYYLYNQELKNFKIAVINDYKLQSINNKRDFTVNEVTTFEKLTEIYDIDSNRNIPYKDSWYVKRRFFEHPYYDYRIYAFCLNEMVHSIVVVREVSHEDAKALRIVDYYGEQEIFSYSGSFWKKYLTDNEYEYVDFYEYGFCSKYITNAGFNLRTENDVNIIPNYFEPFVQENAENYIHYKEDNTLFFKADGDQDRPNVIRGV